MKDTIEISELVLALHQSWSRETSSDPDKWKQDNPAWGQCAVTALVVQDYLGGEIVWSDIETPRGHISHYHNKIGSSELDFTRCQFPEWFTIDPGVPKTKGYSSTREYILSYPATKERYEILRAIVEDNLKNC